ALMRLAVKYLPTCRRHLRAVTVVSRLRVRHGWSRSHNGAAADNEPNRPTAGGNSQPTTNPTLTPPESPR
ncbi:hypothetical protein, partial [Streptomyces ureilyticus]|uniref:hypothetical protein n=1 Tax=Streptomyces ureilyticus TaxID=1775131 RepID=UPI0019D2A268